MADNKREEEFSLKVDETDEQFGESKGEDRYPRNEEEQEIWDKLWDETYEEYFNKFGHFPEQSSQEIQVNNQDRQLNQLGDNDDNLLTLAEAADEQNHEGLPDPSADGLSMADVNDPQVTDENLFGSNDVGSEESVFQGEGRTARLTEIRLQDQSTGNLLVQQRVNEYSDETRIRLTKLKCLARSTDHSQLPEAVDEASGESSGAARTIDLQNQAHSSNSQTHKANEDHVMLLDCETPEDNQRYRSFSEILGDQNSIQMVNQEAEEKMALKGRKRGRKPKSGKCCNAGKKKRKANTI